jgi:serine O-acetyltransferase
MKSVNSGDDLGDLEITADLLLQNDQQTQIPTRFYNRAQQLTGRTVGLLFPQLAFHNADTRHTIVEELDFISSEIKDLCDQLVIPSASESGVPRGMDSRSVSLSFVRALPDLRRQLRLDALAIFDGDPAAISLDEVILGYPGFLATALYRIAHRLWELNLPLLPRLISNIAQAKTGIDIHPAAVIGRGFCIDHGTGIVIGETAVIGNGVKLYQGVTLGALSVEKAFAKSKRHPTLEDNVVVYANATILGGDTVIGHDCVVSGNAFITGSIPPFSFALRNGEFRARRPGQTGELEYYI